MAFEIRPSLTGNAEAFIPIADWGLRANAFDAPFEIGAELRSLERPALLRAAEGDLSVLDATEADLRDGARSAALRGFGWGIAVSVALPGVATLIWRRLHPRWALIAIGTALAVVGSGASLWTARASFDASSFESPTYFARGHELGRILEAAENVRVRSEYGFTFASLLRSVSAVIAEEPTAEAPGPTLYLASDLHANALVIDPLARLIGDSPLLLAGDLGQRGGAAEAALLVPRVAALSSRVIAVSGNHDSRRLMGRLATEDVTVLGKAGRRQPSGGEGGSPLVEVDGLAVAGFLAEALAETLLERDYSRELTIVTGHDHRQHIGRYGSVIVVDGGSAGAGGVFDAGRQPIGFGELHFRARGAGLRSVDLIAVEPFSGQAQASRVVIDTLCPDEERCGFEPPELEAPPSQ